MDWDDFKDLASFVAWITVAVMMCLGILGALAVVIGLLFFAPVAGLLGGVFWILSLFGVV